MGRYYNISVFEQQMANKRQLAATTSDCVSWDSSSRKFSRLKTPNWGLLKFFAGVKNRRNHAVFHCRCNAPTVHTVAKESRTKRICLVRQVPVLVVASESNQRHNTCWERRWRRKKKAETVIDTAAWLFWARSYQLGATFEREVFWDMVFQMLSIPALFLFVSFLVD